MLAQHLHHRATVLGAHLHHHAQLFVEQRFERELVAPGTDLACPVLAVAVLGPAVADAVALGHQHVHVQRHAHMAGKGHFAHRGPQAAVTAVVISQDAALRAQRIHGSHQGHQVGWVVQVRHLVAGLVQGLGQHAGAHAHAATPQVDQQQAAVGRGVELRRQRPAHIGQRGKGADHQRHRRADFFVLPIVRPLGAHREGIFAHRDGHAQRRAQFKPHRLHRGVERGVFAGLTAGCHPIGRELDARQLNWRRQQIGDGLGHRHPARGGRIDSGQRRAFAHAHGLAGKAGKISQRYRAIGHRHLPGAHHLIAVAQTAHGTVADGDQKPLRGHGGTCQHRNTGLLQGDTVQVQRRKLPLQADHVALHLGRLAQQHIHGHIDRQVGWLGGFGICQHQMPGLGSHPDHGKRASLALAQGAKQGQ